MKSKFLILFLLFVFLSTSAFGCKQKPSSTTTKAMKPMTLTYWRVYDDEDVFSQIIANYQKIHPYITIEYKKFRYEEYEKELLNALAEDRGPDLFSLPSSWLREYQPKLAPLPESTTMVYPVVKGSIQKEVVPELRTTKSMSLKTLKSNFVDIVYNDVILNQEGQAKIYGLPMYMDTLAMFYNQDLLNNAGLTEAPKYWNTVQESVKKLTKQNTKGNIIQSGIAMGGNENIGRAVDILSLLMMQNGANMMRDGVIAFQNVPEGSERDYNPGMEALRFYTDFSNSGKEVYCWNSNMKNSLDLFAEGNLAMMFSYSFNIPVIRARNPKLNFFISKMPQIKDNSKQINYANYWTEVVSAKSKNIDAAWDFIQFETSAEQVESYLTAAKRPTALRALINKQIDDLDLGIFAEQTLTAQSWYQGKDARTAEKDMGEMINLAVKNELKLEDIINQGAQKIQQTIE